MDNKDQEQPRVQHDVCRVGAKIALRHLIGRLRKRVNDLQILHDTLPEKLSSEQDEAIWSIVNSMRD